MTQIKSTIDQQEINKFAQHASHWWDVKGPLRTLHDINGARLSFIGQYIDFKQSDILDVGCGGGILSEAMAKSGAKVTGLDAEIEAIEAAKAHAQEQNLALDYVCTPIENYDSQSFDAITCMEMLEHVNEPELVLEHCKRLLKPNGYLFLSTINRTLKAYAGAIIAAEYILNLLPKQTHDYNKFITPSELAGMARNLDLELIDLRGLLYNPLSRKASLGADVSINYLATLQYR